MRKRIVFMFSGQGSHYFQMGRALYDQDPVFKARMLAMDELVRAQYGWSVVDVLYREDHRKGMVFDQARWTNPAIVMVELAMAESLMARGVQPDLLLGSSLGTYPAAVLGGGCTWEAAVTAVIEQALTFEAHCPRGAMTAIVAPVSTFHELGWSRHGELGAVNYPSHFVVSSDLPGAEAIERDAKARQLVHVRLEVAYAFHSRWIEPARAAMLAHPRRVTLGPLSLPVMCCAQAELLPAVVPADHFWQVARQPIHFMDAFRKLEAQGPCHYIDVGPAGTLANFAKQMLPPEAASQQHTVMTPFGTELRNLDRLLTALHAA